MRSQFWTRQILFRDYLRAHSEIRRESAKLKQKFAIQHACDRLAYVEAKTEFVTGVLDLSREEKELLTSS